MRRIIYRQPGLLSPTVTGDAERKIECFWKEMGLGSGKIPKIGRTHPQASIVDLSTKK